MERYNTKLPSGIEGSEQIEQILRDHGLPGTSAWRCICSPICYPNEDSCPCLNRATNQRGQFLYNLPVTHTDFSSTTRFLS